MGGGMEGVGRVAEEEEEEVGEEEGGMRVYVCIWMGLQGAASVKGKGTREYSKHLDSACAGAFTAL